MQNPNRRWNLVRAMREGGLVPPTRVAAAIIGQPRVAQSSLQSNAHAEKLPQTGQDFLSGCVRSGSSCLDMRVSKSLFHIE